MFFISIMVKVLEIGNSRTIFPVNRKFPDRCSRITEHPRILFQKIQVSEKLIRNFQGKGSRKTLVILNLRER